MTITAFARKQRRWRAAAASLMLGAWLTAAAGAQSPAASVDVRDAWIRWLPSGLPAAGYMTLINRSDRPLELTAVSSDAYQEIGLHHSMNHEGMSHMEAVKQISVPPHSTVPFAPAGYHLMLMQPTHTLAPGDHVTLVLHFAGGAERAVSFEVRGPNGGAPAHADMPAMPGMHEPPAPR
jgi:copper(I)-binding protein